VEKEKEQAVVRVKESIGWDRNPQSKNY